jgi:hypothetical protein
MTGSKRAPGSWRGGTPRQPSVDTLTLASMGHSGPARKWVARLASVAREGLVDDTWGLRCKRRTH